MINFTFRAFAPHCCRQFITLGPSRSDRDTVLVPVADRASGDSGGGRREDARENYFAI